MTAQSNAVPTYAATQSTSAPSRFAGHPGRTTPQRKYTITYLRPNGEIDEVSSIAPATPAFEDAFGALGRGTILQSQHGPVAVEDLLPGDRLRLSDGNFAPLLWRGMMTITPSPTDTGPSRLSLTRITADALGIGRPMQDLILGPSARLYHCTNGVMKLTGKSAAYIPARDFVDGNQFIELRPAAAVHVYQLGFATHETLMVNGIGVESLHPGTAFSLGLRGETLAQYLALFPHLRRLDDVGLFKHPRLRLHDLDMID
ncbi:Hint domain-containing protein [Yoonia vestfoldensis]|uniref:Hint domain-containing protein n=1 Tax=Yoonia vestfoldensis TaxID=245188 RepID=UPI00037A1E34|nr:Hint domain-containing protein [Yoonia vestfoldensis]